MMTLKLLRPAVAAQYRNRARTCPCPCTFTCTFTIPQSASASASASAASASAASPTCYNTFRGFATKREQRASDSGKLTDKSALEIDREAKAELDAAKAAAAAAKTAAAATPTNQLDGSQPWSPSSVTSSKPKQSSPALILNSTDHVHRQLTETFHKIKSERNSSNGNSNGGSNLGIDNLEPAEQAYHVDLFDAKIHLPRAPTDWSGYEAVTPLSDHLTAQIGVSGVPISTAAYMVAALTHPTFGYYVQAGQQRQQQQQQQNNSKSASGASGGGGGSAAIDTDDFDDDDYDLVEETAPASNTAAAAAAANSAATTSDATSPTPTPTQHIIGPTGDFVTAPEVSSIFTETLGIWLYTQHQQLQQSSSSSSSKSTSSKSSSKSKQQQQQQWQWQWLECGPGAGTLTVDLVRFAQQLPDFGSSLSHVHLVEASPVLRKVQKERLRGIETTTTTATASESTKSKSSKADHKIRFRFLDDDAAAAAAASPDDNVDDAVQQMEKKLERAVNQNKNDNKNDSLKKDDDDDVKTAAAEEEEGGEEENNNNSANEHIIDVCWHDSLAAFQAWQVDHDVSLPIFTVWQEFLDALPVYAFEKTSEGWRERMVDVVIRQELMDEEDLRKEEEEAVRTSPASALAAGSNNDDDNNNKSNNNVKKPRFRLVLAPEVTPALKTLLQVDEQGNLPNKELDSAPVGSVIEVNPEAILVAQDLAKLLEKQGGAGLIIDYGQDGSTDSIRAFRKHQQVHFLSRPGQVDVTADVDFAAIRHAVNALALPEVQAFGPTTQGQFLMAMGIQERVIQLIESDHTTEEEAENLFEALKRLVGPEEMGARYKVLAIARKKEGIFEPPGFDYLNRPK